MAEKRFKIGRDNTEKRAQFGALIKIRISSLVPKPSLKIDWISPLGILCLRVHKSICSSLSNISILLQVYITLSHAFFIDIGKWMYKFFSLISPFIIFMTTFSPCAPILVVILKSSFNKAAIPNEHQAQFPHHSPFADLTRKFVGAKENGWKIDFILFLVNYNKTIV